MCSTCLCSKHTQDTRPTSNIKDKFSLEQVFIFDDSILIGSRPDGILEHFFMYSYTHQSEQKRVTTFV